MCLLASPPRRQARHCSLSSECAQLLKRRKLFSFHENAVIMVKLASEADWFGDGIHYSVVAYDKPDLAVT